jgi:hypothetical protein
VHYPPSYYHFHIHVTAATFAPENDRVGRAHLLDDIIENLEASPPPHVRRLPTTDMHIACVCSATPRTTRLGRSPSCWRNHKRCMSELDAISAFSGGERPGRVLIQRAAAGRDDRHKPTAVL